MTQTSISIPSGTCLLTRLKEELLRDCDDLSQVHVVLPTQRLHVFLARELAHASGGACLLPRLWTWDQFVQELCVNYESDSMVMVSSQCELIMEHVLDRLTTAAQQQNRPINTSRRHAHELLYLASELDKSGLHDVAQQKLVDWLDRDWRRDDTVKRDILARVDDVFNAIKEFKATMSSRGWITESAARSEAVKRWLTDASPQIMPTARRIMIAGLTSLPELEAQVLARLARDQRVQIWLDTPPADVDHAPLAMLRQRVGLDAGPAPASPQAPIVWASGVRHIIATADVTSEIHASLLWAKNLVEQGIPAHEIAIVVPDEAAYASAYQALAPLINVPVNMPLAETWEGTLPARWLHLLTEVPKGFKTGVIGQYLLHPMTQTLFGGTGQHLGLDETKLQLCLKDFPEPQTLQRSGSQASAPSAFLEESLPEFLAKRFSPDDVSYITKAISYAVGSLHTKHEPSVDDFAAALLSDLVTLRARFKSRGPREDAAWKHCETAVLRVQALAGLKLQKKSVEASWREFLSQCYRCAATESVRATGEPMHGIQIIGLTEARYVPFAAVRIVGCVEGSFPHALPRDSLVDNGMRQAMGLVGWRELEALEDTTFHLLTARLRWVELSYARASDDQPLIRSRWIERLAASINIEDDVTEALADHHLVSSPNQRLPEPKLGPEGMTPQFKELTAKASASRLRDLIWCPYRYLMSARKINAVELPEDRTQLKTGNILHKILELFFTTDADARIDQSLRFERCPEDVALFVDWAHQRLDALALVTTPKQMARLPQFQHMTGRGWRQVAESWGAMHRAGFAPKQVKTELKIGRTSPLTMRVGRRDIAIDGSIDAVFQSPEGTILVDYKTGANPTAKALGDGFEPQLPLYAWALSSQEPLTAKAVSYINLSAGQQSIVAVTADLKQHITATGLISTSNKPADLNEAFTSVKTRWAARLQEIETTARFMADPSACDFCPYENICRKNDPREKDRINAQKQVKSP